MVAGEQLIRLTLRTSWDILRAAKSMQVTNASTANLQHYKARMKENLTTTYILTTKAES